MRWLIALMLLAVPPAGTEESPDQYTPLVAAPLTANTQPVPGIDGKYHVVYELLLTNAQPLTSVLKKIEVLDAGHPSTVIAAYQGTDLVAHLRTLGNTAAPGAEIEFNGTRLFLIDLVFNSRAAVPSRLVHRFALLGGSPGASAASPFKYTVASFEITRHIPEIGPPLTGNGWVALNGCCEVASGHRSSVAPVNGRLCFAQRFAIDWMQLDGAGRLVHGDPSNVHNYTGYGADVIAVADGEVLDTLNELDDQVPGKLPDPKTITLQNVDGNHIVEDLGGGVYAFYAHLEKDSIRVKAGARVKRGQVLARLGNTGNTSAPHLHFHLMDGPSVLGSNGIPYVIDRFSIAGQIPAGKNAAEVGVEGNFKEGLFSKPSLRQNHFPLDLAIVNFSQ
jgi:hypothetical protein